MQFCKGMEPRPYLMRSVNVELGNEGHGIIKDLCICTWNERADAVEGGDSSLLLLVTKVRTQSLDDGGAEFSDLGDHGLG
jgi:hypothetical protein